MPVHDNGAAPAGGLSGEGSVMIRAEGLTKRFGDRVAVEDLSFTVAAGAVTGFLGPNGAGKSTTLRMLVGLVRPDAGGATIGGRPYASLSAPMSTVGAALDAQAFHPGRTGRDHLRALTLAAGLPASRVDQALALVELTLAARRRVGTYSLGMRQRLALAGALLGDPQVLILDEPANGLDPGGIRWLRDRLRALADDGRTVLLSSHVLAEVAQIADAAVIIRTGRLVALGDLDSIARSVRAGLIRARTPQAARLAELLAAQPGIEVTTNGDAQRLLVRGTSAARVGELAGQHGIALHELAEERTALEDAYLELTADGGMTR